jgi:hypothetical protein
MIGDLEGFNRLKLRRAKKVGDELSDAAAPDKLTESCRRYLEKRFRSFQAGFSSSDRPGIGSYSSTIDDPTTNATGQTRNDVLALNLFSYLLVRRAGRGGRE